MSSNLYFGNCFSNPKVYLSFGFILFYFIFFNDFNFRLEFKFVDLDWFSGVFIDLNILQMVFATRIFNFPYVDFCFDFLFFENMMLRKKIAYDHRAVEVVGFSSKLCLYIVRGFFRS